MISLKNNFKIARTNARLTQEQVADILKISWRTYQAYELGCREPKYSTLCKLADLFNVSTDFLLGRNTPITPQTFNSDEEFMSLYSKLPPDIKQLFYDNLLKLTPFILNK